MRIPATLMRGGTSKCWLFDRDAVPSDRDALAELLIELFGADDPRQLDGVGGGTSVTSKAVIIARSSEPDIDVDYLFAQVAIGAHVVEWGSNCGNCATAVALWAVQQFGLPRGETGHTTVRMRNLNTSAVVVARVAGDEADDVSVPGVRGTGTAVDLAFVDPAGSTTGSLWPLGEPLSTLLVDGSEFEVTLADAGAPVVLVAASALGLTPAAGEVDVLAHVPLLRRIRAHAAVAMGLASSVETAGDAVPKVGVVGPAVDYVTSLGERVAASDYDVSVRMLSMNAPHPTIGLTSAVAVALAAGGAGSVLTNAGVDPSTTAVRLGTLGGPLRCEVQSDATGTRVLLQRAARRIADSELLTHHSLAH
ncbi:MULTISPECIES: PrpF domain-containing protein [unclassified Rathayibacter]|uniref:PrpF domain-containing protein n=1 Tax=unclassified Rathayibacter TaxID=2609250 RepID=UPI00188B7E59|nr:MULTISPECIES: PrpF domain-containing protein [unclassified Rathayibacter]MBF4461137.1 PrpF, AcnD-accessory [Rathayibacter sp. VKM Ac-2879]MBF4502548.1 PrpF, AcnD-accessory [Rathayibacter sp. VKM Ac-2878]